MDELLQGGPKYSIASCVVETGHRLVATSADEPGYEALRRAGRALLAAEVLSFSRIQDESQRRKYGQGLVLSLGFYDRASVRAIEAVGGVGDIREDRIAEEIGFSVGGWPWGIQLDLSVLESETDWLGKRYEWPTENPATHLDLFKGPLPSRAQVSKPGILQVLGRRLRYRLGVDHASGSHNLFWWTTPQTEEWIVRLIGQPGAAIDRNVRRAFNSSVADLAFGLWGKPLNCDPLYNTPDDWGQVDLEQDPIAVLAVGPMSVQAQTHSDVAETLALAGNQLTRKAFRVQKSDRDVADPVEPYAEFLESLAEASPERRDADVVVVYRGGFDATRPLTKPQCSRLLDAADRLVSAGVEVVLGIGHRQTSVHKAAGREPQVGVFEAVTPTAAANWVLKEHVNHRLMNLRPDPGQSF